jgi:hypothetical protein
VISSTSPLSPKHLLHKLATAARIHAHGIYDEPEAQESLISVNHPGQFLEHQEQNKGTDCVNFQVGEFGSPSTIFYDPVGGVDVLASGCRDEGCSLYKRLLAGSIASRFVKRCMRVMHERLKRPWSKQG